MARTVFMHVGVAKTGTTYLQRILAANRDVLRAAGLLYPGRQPGDHFVASVDLRGLQAQRYDHLQVDGGWDALAAEVRAFGGDAVISHETFARCSRAEIRTVKAAFPDADLRVVLTVRDLGRQVPAVWQETLKNRAISSYEEFLSDIFVDTDSGEHKFFWRVQDVGQLVSRWAGVVGSSNVTIVTVPPPDAARDELWHRFARALDVPPVRIALPAAAANVSLGPAEAELLRQLNCLLPQDLPWPRYGEAVKRQFAEGVLAPRPTTRIVLPPRWHQAAEARAGDIVATLQTSGCRVVGDLADLTPQLPVQAVSGPDDLAESELLQVAVEVIRDHLVLRAPTPTLGPSPSVRDALSGARAWALRLRGRLRRGA